MSDESSPAIRTDRILSGMRPTGPLHVGHWLGALRNWTRLQDEYDTFFMVADWHALFSDYADTSDLARWSREVVADWIACGVDPEESVLFVQSQVPEHAELHLVFSACTPIGWLERNPTYKETLEQTEGKDLRNYAFLGYPVLQAADILVYRADHVPVGEDQAPHVELTREIARRFNNIFGPLMPEPKTVLMDAGARVLGADRRKMSKSYGNAVEIGMQPDEVRKQVMSFVTDEQRVKLTDPGRPEVCNVHDWYGLFDPDEQPTVAAECRAAERGCVDCKKGLAERVVTALEPMRARREEVLADGSIDDILEAGRRRAAEVARETMADVRDAIGLLGSEGLDV